MSRSVPFGARRLAALLLLAAACGGDSSGPSNNNTQPPPPQPDIDININPGASVTPDDAFTPDPKTVSLNGGASV